MEGLRREAFAAYPCCLLIVLGCNYRGSLTGSRVSGVQLREPLPRLDERPSGENIINIQSASAGARLRVTVPTDRLKPDTWRFDAKGVIFYVKVQFAPIND